jgi:hypothetical protein
MAYTSRDYGGFGIVRLISDYEVTNIQAKVLDNVALTSIPVHAVESPNLLLTSMSLGSTSAHQMI